MLHVNITLSNVSLSFYYPLLLIIIIVINNKYVFLKKYSPYEYDQQRGQNLKKILLKL